MGPQTVKRLKFKENFLIFCENLGQNYFIFSLGLENNSELKKGIW